MIVGILNVTPDSFSDGGNFMQPADAIARATELISQGADIIDIGGDSTRPGSDCVGAEVEWRRIEPIVRGVTQFAPVSVDTHHAAVARKAIEAGASIVNDIWAGRDAGMIQAIAAGRARIILMYSTIKAPHCFEYLETGADLIESIKSFFRERLEFAAECGLAKDRIILDPGMGAFLSPNPARSWELIERFSELSELGCALMLGCSRKGFLRSPGEKAIEERDRLSAEIASRVSAALHGKSELYVRTHNPGSST